MFENLLPRFRWMASSDPYRVPRPLKLDING